MKPTAFDTETFLITRCRPLPPLVCLSWAQDDRAAVVPRHAAKDWISRHLQDPETLFVGHNIAYDFGVTCAAYPDLMSAVFDAYRSGRVTDTQLRQQLVDIATGRTMADDKLHAYGLARLYALCFDRDMPGPGKGSDSWRLRYGELYDVDFAQWPDDAVDYPRADAECTLQIYMEQQRAADLIRDDGAQAYAAFALSLISARGMRTDPERVAAFKAQQLELMAALEPELAACGLIEPKMQGRGDAKVQVGWVKKTRPAQQRIADACAARGVEPMLTDAGVKLLRSGGVPGVQHYSIDRTACHWALDPVMLRRAEYVTAEKMVSTYVPFLEAGAVGPVTCRFGLAATGRTTSSTPSPPAAGGNRQNEPRKTKMWNAATGTIEDSPLGVRECFQARPGKVILSGDLSGAELHGVAQVCLWKFGYSMLGEALQAGRDVHLVLACYLLGGNDRDYDDVRTRYAQEDPDVVEARQQAKPGNFGFWGAMGVRTFIKTQLREGKLWTLEAATKLRRAFGDSWREAQDYIDAGKFELGPKGQAVVEFYHSKRLRKVRGLSTICNGWFQAIVADGTKRATCEIVRLCYVGGSSSALWANNTRPCNFIHDELVTETDDVSPELLAPVVAEFSGTMAREFNTLVPDYPTHVDAVLSYKTSKRAKPVYNSEGHLIPWLD